MATNHPPQSRVEKILHATMGEQIALEPPQSRVEEDLLALKEVIEQGGGGGGGTNDYNKLINKPTLNGTTLEGDMTSTDVGVASNGSRNTYDGSDEEVTIGGGGSGNTYDPDSESVVIGGL